VNTYFFGCKRNADKNPLGQVGHYHYGADAQSLYGNWRSIKHPWGDEEKGIYPDGNLCPKNTTKEGVANLHHKDGWTALSFWDYSGDTRGASNSNFFFEGTFTFDEAKELMGKFYPSIVDRFKFVVTENR